MSDTKLEAEEIDGEQPRVVRSRNPRNNDVRRQQLLGFMRNPPPPRQEVPQRQEGWTRGVLPPRQVPQNPMPPPPLPPQDRIIIEEVPNPPGENIIIEERQPEGEGNNPPGETIVIAEQQPEGEQIVPPPVPVPKLVLPEDKSKAIALIGRTANGIQQSLRNAYGEVEDSFAFVIEAREEPAEEKRTKAMQRILAAVRKDATLCDGELARLLLLQEQLRGLDVLVEGTPQKTLAAWTAADDALVAQIAKARSICEAAHGYADAVQREVDGGDPLGPREQLAPYQPIPGELPTLLRNFSAKLRDTVANLELAGRELLPQLEEATTLHGLALKSPQRLPENAALRAQELSTEATRTGKSFSKWNETTLKPYRVLEQSVKALEDPKDPECVELMRRVTSEYDGYTAAYSVAAERANSIIHLTKLVGLQTAAALSKPWASAEVPLGQLRDMQKTLETLEVAVTNPLNRLEGKQEQLPEKRQRMAASESLALGPLDAVLVELHRDMETLTNNLLPPLDRARQEVELVTNLLKSEYAGNPALRQQVELLRGLAGRVMQLVTPGLKQCNETIGAYRKLLDGAEKARKAMGEPAPIEDMLRLPGVVANIVLPGKDALFPPGGMDVWKGQVARGGDRKGTSLFADVTKAWGKAEATSGEDQLAALEQAALAYLEHAKANGLAEGVDADRSAKCREALRLVRKMRLANDQASLPPPPWTAEQARAARRIEAVSLLENGGQARPPSGKGESDSFFLNDSEGKPSFIFKPMEGENVKEGGKPGDGVVREVLASKFNDQIKAMTGLDFGVSPTELMRLESDSFASGELSQATSRTGAMQQTVANEGSLLDICGEDPEAYKSIPVEDVQKIALLDFLTLQPDRNAGNMLLQDDGTGRKRMVPIDAGFAFPTTDMVEGYSEGMASGLPGSKTGEVGPQGNGLMALPQSDQPFTSDMLAVIAKLDPDEMAKGMLQATAEIDEGSPDLAGRVGKENIENMRRAALFLKKAAPEFTVAELANIFAFDFKAVLRLPARELDRALDKLVERGRARAAFDRDVAQQQKRYEELGGDQALRQLGWSLNDRMLQKDWRRKIAILETAEAAPPVVNDPVLPPASEQVYTGLGGDRLLAGLLQRRPDMAKLRVSIEGSNLPRKVAVLRAWQDYEAAGGDRVLDRMLELKLRHEVDRFDTLAPEAKAAVAAVASNRYAPETWSMQDKSDVLKLFRKMGG